MPRRAIDTAIWTDRRFGDLSAPAQLIYFRLVTGDDTGAAGATTTSPKRLAVDTNLERAEVDRALEELVAAGLARRFDDWLWMPAWIRYQLSGPGFIRAVRRQARECPPSLRTAIARALDDLIGPEKGTEDENRTATEPRQETLPVAGGKGVRPPVPPPVGPPVSPGSDRGLFEREVQDQDQDQDPSPLRGEKGPSTSATAPAPGAQSPPSEPWSLETGEDDAPSAGGYPPPDDFGSPCPPDVAAGSPIVRAAIARRAARAGRGP